MTDEEIFAIAAAAPSMAACVCEADMEIVPDPDHPGVLHMMIMHDDGCPLAGPPTENSERAYRGQPENRKLRRARLRRTP